jgi:DNA-binding NarL/FixJ family response regulator
VVTQGGGDAGFRGQPQDGDGQVAWDEANRHDRLAGLSARERKVLGLIGEGLTNRQIGECQPSRY